jgi:hypothetical protein
MEAGFPLLPYGQYQNGVVFCVTVVERDVASFSL